MVLKNVNLPVDLAYENLRHSVRAPVLIATLDSKCNEQKLD